MKTDRWEGRVLINSGTGRKNERLILNDLDDVLNALVVRVIYFRTPFCRGEKLIDNETAKKEELILIL